LKETDVSEALMMEAACSKQHWSISTRLHSAVSQKEKLGAIDMTLGEMWSLYFILGAQELSSNPLHHVYSLL
jgi:hypothetical protein